MLWGKYQQFGRSNSWILSVAAVVLLPAFGGTARAGIFLPKSVTFEASDLASSLRDNSARKTATCKHSSFPVRDRGGDPNPLRDQFDVLKGHLPNGTNSSSGTSSSTSSGGISSSFVCALNCSAVIAEDPISGRLADDYGLSRPDPPGTNLLLPATQF